MYNKAIRIRLRNTKSYLYQCPRYSSIYTTPATTGASQAELASAKNYCSDLLQKYDSPSYTLQTFLPPTCQTAHLALRAFNIETSRIADSVSTPTVGSMRLQFWRDNISKAFAGSPPKQPVAILLSHVLEDLTTRSGERASLSKAWFMRVISAREMYLGNPPYPDLQALERYAENTYSTLLYLTLQALPLSSLTADHIASHIGKAAGIVAVLRGLPLVAFPGPPKHHSNRSGLGGSLDARHRSSPGAVLLPLDIMAETGVREEDVLRLGAEAPGLRDAVFAVATRASDHLITARQMLRNVRAGEDVGHEFEHGGEEGHEHYSNSSSTSAQSKNQQQNQEIGRAFGVFMPAIATSLWLEKLQKYDFDVFREELRRREWILPWRAYWGFRRRMF